MSFTLLATAGLRTLSTTAFSAVSSRSSVTAFRQLATKAGTTTAADTRLFSTTPPMPYDDEKMPFYALGANLAVQVGGQANFQTLLDDDEMDIVLKAFCDTLRGASDSTTTRTILSTYGPGLNKILQERTVRIMDRVKKDGEDYIANFLDCNKEAIKTDTGLVYCEMKAGDGKQPTLKSTVEVHYHGTLTDGTVFDSSVDRGQTISFPLAGVIQGWQQGLQMMKEGGKATLVIPGDLAYGDAGSGEGT
jgi:FKBP-type peptidyl-prolyl cis-trans isomerase FkpA